MLIDKASLDEAYTRIKEDSQNQGCTILLLVSPEPDSVCACKIFTGLLRTDNISYKIKPVSGYDDLDQANQDLIKDNEETRSLVLINCGGIVDLEDFFDLPEHTTVYVIDSHRPYHLANVEATNEKIVVLDEGDGLLDGYPSAPDFSEEDSEDSDEGDEDASGDEEGRPSKKRRTEQDEEKRRRRRKRQEIQNYYKGSYYGQSAASLVYEISKQLNKDSNQLLWHSIVGITDQFVNERVSREQYTMSVSDCQEEVDKHNVVNDDEDGKASEDSLVSVAAHGNITFDYEYRFMLLRHWNLYASMYHSQYVASRLGIWKESGRKKLQKFLVKMGLPLEECKVSYHQMAERYKKHLKTQIEEEAPKHGLGDVMYGSFSKQHGTTMRISATDMVYAITALLEDLGPEEDVEDAEDTETRWERNFWRSYDALSRTDIALLKRGLDQSIQLQEAVVKQGTGMIRKGVIVHLNDFRYAVINDSPDLQLFSQPLALAKLLLFLVDASNEIRKKKREKEISKQGLADDKNPADRAKAKAKPFVLCSFIEQRQTYLCVGGTGQGSGGSGTRFGSSGQTKNNFGVIFREAADKTNAAIKHDGFETAVMEVQKDDLHKFLEVLHFGLVEIS